MARRQLSKGQVIAIALLWIALVALLFFYSKKFDFETIFTAIASGLIILLAISKNRG